MNEVNTREGAMKQFFRFQDDMAMARQRGELKDLRPREVKVPKQEKTPLMLEAPKPGAKGRMLSTRKPNVVTQTPEVIYQGKVKPEITERSKIVNPQKVEPTAQKKTEIAPKETVPKKEAPKPVKKASETPKAPEKKVPPEAVAPETKPKFDEKPTEGMTEKERVQYELDKKQAASEFKDVNERIAGSRKEKAQYSKLSMEQYQKVESESAALANDLVTKERVLASKYEPKVAREA